MRSTTLVLALAGALAAASFPAGALPDPGDSGEARWLAGDWHVHTNASHDACGAHNADGFVQDLEEGCGDGPHTLSADGATRMRQAEARGLDYLRITDHNTLGGPLHAQANYEGPVTLVPGYEHSLPNAHAGVSSSNLLDRGVFYDPSQPSEIDGWIDTVQEEPGGFVAANHPFYSEPSAWSNGDVDWSKVDVLELWNIHWLWREELFGDLATTSDNHETLALWTDLLNAGHRLPIVGASDNHWLATTAVQGPGQPTTWVKAEANEPEEIVEAARDGHTYVTWDPAGPRVTFTGTGAGEATAIPGEELAVGEELSFRVQVTAGAGERIRLVSCHGIEAEGAPGVPLLETSVTFQEDCWVRADLVTVDDARGHSPDDLVYRAITNPIYVR